MKKGKGGIPFGKKKSRGPSGGQAKGPPLMPPGMPAGPPGLMPGGPPMPIGGSPMAGGGPGMMDPAKAAMLAKLLAGEG